MFILTHIYIYIHHLYKWISIILYGNIPIRDSLPPHPPHAPHRPSADRPGMGSGGGESLMGVFPYWTYDICIYIYIYVLCIYLEMESVETNRCT